MAEVRYDQFEFAQGEVDPKIQSRPDWLGYYKSLKYARNVQVIPQGGVQRRWGSVYVDTCTVGNPNVASQFEMCTLLYDDTAVYLLIWEPLSVKIYLENVLVATLTTTYQAEDIAFLRFTQVENRLIITNANFQPAQVVRSANAANAITGIDSVNQYLAVTTALTPGQVLPVQFTATGSLPTTSPQIYVNRNYFIRVINALNVRVYSTSADAINNVNFYTVTALGTTSNVVIQNTWALSNITFINTPAYDFNGGYSAITFTPSATSGNAVTITASAPIYTAGMVGGLFTGNAGSLRIVTVNSSTVVTGYTIHSFADTTAIEGTLAFLGEPAWSNARGWPKYASFFQNRLVFGGSYSLPNGVWLSVVNAAYNFDDSQALDDDAIGWYPAGGTINLIVGITSARSLMIHTNNGTFSTPLLTEVPVTPTNFTLTEQNKFAVRPIQPIFIDNQIIFVDTASNVLNMIWEIAQSAFITNNISVMSSSLINAPVDMASFYEPIATDGFYALFVNGDGTLAVYQTLHEQNIAAWSLMNTVTNIVSDQLNGYTTLPANYIHVITGNNRCWFLVQKQLPQAGSPLAITSFTSINGFQTVTPHGIPLTGSTLISFATTGILPGTSPQINTTGYWFAKATTPINFQVYTNAQDAANGTNAITISSLGTNTTVIVWPLQNSVTIEELSFNVLTDSATVQTLPAAGTLVQGLSHLNGTVVNVKGDGYLLNNNTVFNAQVRTEAQSTQYEVGINYISQVTPLPVSIPQVFGILYKPKHIRALYIRYYQSIGVTLQGFNIPVITMQQQVLGAFPAPQDGVFLATPMEGWDNFDVSSNNDINILQTNPLPMTILGLSYVLEV